MQGRLFFSPSVSGSDYWTGNFCVTPTRLFGTAVAAGELVAILAG